MGSCLKEHVKFMTLALGPDVGNQETTHFWRLSCPIPPLNVGWGGEADMYRGYYKILLFKADAIKA